MNPELPHDPSIELEARLTALLLGELPPDEAQALRQTLASDPELAALHHRLSLTLDLVRETAGAGAEVHVGPAAPLRLSAARREALLASFKTVRPAELAQPRGRRISWLVPLAAAASVALLCGVLLLPSFSRAKQKAQRISNYNLPDSPNASSQSQPFVTASAENREALSSAILKTKSLVAASGNIPVAPPQSALTSPPQSIERAKIYTPVLSEVAENPVRLSIEDKASSASAVAATPSEEANKKPEVFFLTHADSKEVAQQLKDVFSAQDKTSSSAGALGGNPHAIFGGRSGLGGGIAAIDGSVATAQVNAVADEQNNAVVINARPDLMPGISNLISKLDTPPTEQVQLKVLPLKHADPKDVATELGALFPNDDGRDQVARFGGANSSTPTGSFAIRQQNDSLRTVPSVQAVPDERTQSVLVTAPKDEIAKIEKIVDDLDSNPSHAIQGFVFHPVGGDVTDMQGPLQDLFGTTTDRATGTSALTQRAQQAAQNGGNLSTASLNGSGHGANGALANGGAIISDSPFNRNTDQTVTRPPAAQSGSGSSTRPVYVPNGQIGAINMTMDPVSGSVISTTDSNNNSNVVRALSEANREAGETADVRARLLSSRDSTTGNGTLADSASADQGTHVADTIFNYSSAINQPNGGSTQNYGVPETVYDLAWAGRTTNGVLAIPESQRKELLNRAMEQQLQSSQQDLYLNVRPEQDSLSALSKQPIATVNQPTNIDAVTFQNQGNFDLNGAAPSQTNGGVYSLNAVGYVDVAAPGLYRELNTTNIIVAGSSIGVPVTTVVAAAGTPIHDLDSVQVSPSLALADATRESTTAPTPPVNGGGGGRRGRRGGVGGGGGGFAGGGGGGGGYGMAVAGPVLDFTPGEAAPTKPADPAVVDRLETRRVTQGEVAANASRTVGFSNLFGVASQGIAPFRDQSSGPFDSVDRAKLDKSNARPDLDDTSPRVEATIYSNRRAAESVATTSSAGATQGQRQGSAWSAGSDKPGIAAEGNIDVNTATLGANAQKDDRRLRNPMAPPAKLLAPDFANQISTPVVLPLGAATTAAEPGFQFDLAENSTASSAVTPHYQVKQQVTPVNTYDGSTVALTAGAPQGSNNIALGNTALVGRLFKSEPPASPAPSANAPGQSLQTRTFHLADPAKFITDLKGVSDSITAGAANSSGGGGGGFGGGGGGFGGGGISGASSGAVSYPIVNAARRARAVGAGAAQGGSLESVTEQASVSSNNALVRQYLSAVGVNLNTNSGAFAFYNDKTGTILMRGTESDLETASQALQELDIPASGHTVQTASSVASNKSSAAEVGHVSDNKTMTALPGVEMASAQVAALVQDGKLLYELGRFDEAEAKLKQALKTDPSNTAVPHDLDLIQEARYTNAARGRETADNKTLLNVEKEWLQPTMDESLPQPRASANNTNGIYASAGRQAIGAKLQNIRLSELDLGEGGRSLSEVMRTLKDESRNRDLEGKGINFTYNSGAASAPNAGTSRATLATAPQIDAKDITVRINPPLDDLSLKDALDAICQVADLPPGSPTGKLAYTIGDDGIRFYVQPPQASTPGTPFAAKASIPSPQPSVISPKPTTNSPIPQAEILTASNAFSTFSLNVSDVSFKLAEASLQKGALPDPATVRSEEFINAFDYRDPEAAPGAPIGFAWDRAGYPFAHNRDLLRFSVKTAAQGRDTGRPLNIVLLLDKSGSMERADRVAIIHEALRVLGRQLQPRDTLSVVLFARTARLWADGVSGSQAASLAENLDGVTPEGGTNLEDAMKLAYETALRHYLANGENRVVILTDGAANLGDVKPEDLQEKAKGERTQGIALDCFGVGWEDYNDNLLETLSRAGGGRYGFINTPEQADTEFAAQLAGALRVAASDVKVQVEFNPSRVTSYRQIGYAKDQLTKEQFRDNTVKAAQLGVKESGNALYTVELNSQGYGPICTVHVRYRTPGASDYYEHAWDVPYTGASPALDQAGPALRLAASASAFSEWLAGSPYAGEVNPGQLLGYVRDLPELYGPDRRPAELVQMLHEAQSIAGR